MAAADTAAVSNTEAIMRRSFSRATPGDWKARLKQDEVQALDLSLVVAVRARVPARPTLRGADHAAGGHRRIRGVPGLAARRNAPAGRIDARAVEKLDTIAGPWLAAERERYLYGRSLDL